ERNTGKGDDDDAEENGAAGAAGHQDGDEDKSGGGEKHLGIGSLAKPNKGGGIGDDDFRITQADEGDEQADAGGGAAREAIGDAGEGLFAHWCEGEGAEKEAGK